MKVPTIRLFGPAREIAGRAVDELPGTSVAEITEAAAHRYGDRFCALLPACRVWVNGRSAEPATEICDTDEVAILPPVSGG